MSRASSLDRDDAMSMGSARPGGKGESSRVLKIKRLVSLSQTGLFPPFPRA